MHSVCFHSDSVLEMTTLIEMERDDRLLRVGEKGDACGYKGGSLRGPHGDETVLYVDCGGGYMNSHMWQNCIDLYN